MREWSDKINDLVDLVVSIGGAIASSVLHYGAVRTWGKFVATSHVIFKISQAEQVPISGLRELLFSQSSESGSQSSSSEMLVLVSGVFQANLENYLKCDAKSASLSHGEMTSSTSNPFILSQEDFSHVCVCLEGWDKLPSLGVFDTHKMFLCYRSVGQKMNAVGIYSLQDGDPQIKACNMLPFFLTKLTRDEMVERMKDSRNVYFCVTHALIMVSIVVLLKYTIPKSRGCGKSGSICRRPEDLLLMKTSV